MEVFVALENLKEQSTCFFFCETAAFSYEFGQVSTWTVFSDDVAIVLGAEGMLIPQQAGVAGLFEAFDFVVEHGM